MNHKQAAMSQQPRQSGFPWQYLIFGIVVILSFFLFQSTVGQRSLLACVCLGALEMLLVFSPRLGVPALLVFLAFLGGVRRWLIPVLGWTSTDPLVLVGPIIAILFFLNLLATRKLPTDTRLARLQLWLLGLMVLEIGNPLQGGITVGIAGALFYIVPMLWYYLGRQFGSAIVIKRVFQAAIGIAILAALYGLYQTWFGFLPSELEWIRLSNIASLNVNGAIRAISFFTSAQEYSGFLGIAMVLLWAFCLRGYKLALIPIPLLALAIFLESSRGPIIVILAVCTALWAIQGRRPITWVPRGLLALLIAVVGLVWSLQEAQTANFSSQTQALVDHQTQGLLDPTNAKNSTAGAHSAMVGGGILRGFTTPIGLGLGATTIAAGKFKEGIGNSDDGLGSSEVDVSNMFISLGFIGGILYLVIIGFVLFKAFRFWHLTRTNVALGMLAILLLNLGAWLNGQLYAAAFLSWVCIGALDRMQTDWVRTPPQKKRLPGIPFPEGAEV